MGFVLVIIKALNWCLMRMCPTSCSLKLYFVHYRNMVSCHNNDGIRSNRNVHGTKTIYIYLLTQYTISNHALTYSDAWLRHASHVTNWSLTMTMYNCAWNLDSRSNFYVSSLVSWQQFSPMREEIAYITWSNNNLNDNWRVANLGLISIWIANFYWYYWL